MEAPNFDQLKRAYSLYTDAELLHLAGEFEGLTGQARDVLRFEIRQRGLEIQDISSEPVPEVTQLPSDSKRPRASRWNWIWPTITNEDEAKNAAKSGAYGALFVALCTGGIATIAIATGRSYAGIDGYGLVDAVLFVLIAWRLFRYSFPWAVFGLSIYLAGALLKFRSDPKQIGAMAAIISLSFIASVRGTYFLNDRKLKRAEVDAMDTPVSSVQSTRASAGLHSFKFEAVPVVIICVVLLVIIAYHQERAEEKRTSDLLTARLHEAEEESVALQIRKDFAALVKDYKAKNWSEYRSELLSREPYLTDLKAQNNEAQRELVARRTANLDSNDTCGRLEIDEGEPALQAIMKAQDELMYFSKNTIELSADKTSALRLLSIQDTSAWKKWDQYIADKHSHGCDN
jgi:hypothetical protein